MNVGPVEYGVIVFPDNRFHGEIAPAILDLIQSGTVRVIDLTFVLKDIEGVVSVVELDDVGGDVYEAFQAVFADRGGLLSDDDVDGIAEALDPNSSALIIVWEDLWATRLASAVRAAGGIVTDMQRIPAEAVQAALDFAADTNGASA
jgi:hypothetical protein